MKRLESMDASLKPETRILISLCTESLCLGVIVRGPGFDGIVAGRDCSMLCKRLDSRGFTGELRYCLGDCCCRLERPPMNLNPKITNAWRAFLEEVVMCLEGRLCDSDP